MCFRKHLLQSFGSQACLSIGVLLTYAAGQVLFRAVDLQGDLFQISRSRG